MEASCFVTSKAFGKALDLPPASRTRPAAVLFPHTRRRPTLRRAGVPSSTILCCSLGSSSSSSPSPSDDDRLPAIRSDWRTFRARMVAAEHAAAPGADEVPTPAQPAPLGDRWAHTLYELEKGCLLIATEKLDGVHIFERTVVLFLSDGPVGPTGVILNRPSLMSIKETRSVALDVAGTFSERPLFFGGPMEEGLFLVSPPPEGGSAEVVARSGVFEEVMEGLYYGTKESVGCAAEMVKRGAVEVGDFRFFDGYCGWEKEQLRDELRAGYWTVAACSADVIRTAGECSGSLWEEILGLVGERRVR